MINLTTIRAELQARLAAVDSLTPISTLLKRREAAESMGLDHSVIDAEIQARADDVDGSTTDSDLMLLSKLSIRGDKRIGEIVKSPIKADTLDDGSLVRMAGNVVLRSVFPALSSVYQNQLQFGAIEDLGAAAVTLGFNADFKDAVYANGVLVAVSTDGLLRTVDGTNYTKVNRAGYCICYDKHNLRWWLGAPGGLIYYSIDDCATWALNSGKAGVANENIVSIKANGLGGVVCIWQNTGANTTGGYKTSNNGSAWTALTGYAAGSDFLNIDLQYFDSAKNWFILNNKAAGATSLVYSADVTNWSLTVELVNNTGAPYKINIVDDSPTITKLNVYAAFMLSAYDPVRINKTIKPEGWVSKAAANIVQLKSGHVIYDVVEGVYVSSFASGSPARLAVAYTSGYSATNETKLIDCPWGLYRFGRNLSGGSGRTYKISKHAYNTATEMYLPDFGIDSNLNYSYMVAK
jgi:hypothetical protein